MRIDGAVAMVTGGASGLGEACVRDLVKNGARVSILDVTGEKGSALASETGNAAVFLHTDITRDEAVRAAVETTMETFGAVHVAVNCAGIAPPCKVLGREGPMPMEHFRQVVEINLMGTMNVIRLAAEKMRQNPGNRDGEKGVIINTASVSAFEGQIGQAAYSASKAAVAGMTLPIAREFAEYGIRVMTVAPGIFNTPMMAGFSPKVREALNRMVPFPRRMGEPAEFAALVRHIIENPVLNGEVIRLDGALRMAAK
ncbi:MAG: 3-hydroxyacyl-CoA dehydrogenase [Deltaproteobacteria bacterium]|nr:MAG: 3-hydroxyacyl-CoA dehydrogenase [Deltaproteobacteria bacterium]